MTLTENAVPTTPLDVPTGRGAGRLPITDVGSYLNQLPKDARAGLRALGELLVGVTHRPSGAESTDRFTARCLGVTDSVLVVDEDRELNPVSRLTTAVALAEWITAHAEVVEIGPGERAQPPKWTQTEIGDQTYRHPQCLRAHFPAGTLSPTPGA